MNTGSSFGKKTMQMGHARKVWRSITNVFPGGGTITNLADFKAAGCIPCGSPVKFDDEAKTIEVITDAAITAAADVKTLGINGYLQEQVDVDETTQVATGTVVYEGEIYKYMFKKAIVEKLEYLATTPKITWVN